MGIYIKNIDIPIKQEYIDIRIHADGTATMPIGKHPYYRQLEITKVLVPHGKLIDAKRFFEEFTELEVYNSEYNLPTIIEEEGI